LGRGNQFRKQSTLREGIQAKKKQSTAGAKAKSLKEKGDERPLSEDCFGKERDNNKSRDKQALSKQKKKVKMNE